MFDDYLEHYNRNRESLGKIERTTKQNYYNDIFDAEDAVKMKSKVNPNAEVVGDKLAAESLGTKYNPNIVQPLDAGYFDSLLKQAEEMPTQSIAKTVPTKPTTPLNKVDDYWENLMKNEPDVVPEDIIPENIAPENLLKTKPVDNIAQQAAKS